MGRKANRCEACERCDAITKGGKCALHDSSTSPIVERSSAIADRFPGPGWTGPVLYRLAGGRDPKILRRLEQERLEALKRNATPAQRRAVAAGMLAELNESITTDERISECPKL